ncbi:MAG: SDR family NAD(P)-dependent oxidoreductase [Planctomycetota bacterium]|jgi:NAD(P)-dependent dehydrogenase (short-subunit alcohol dehydrogenase family)
MDFTGRTVLITGAAGAIGRDIAAGFFTNGAKIFITDLNQQGLDAITTEFAQDDRCNGLAADVTDAEQVKAVVSAASEAFDSRIDILVNVAGIVGQGNVENITEQEWEGMFAVNCKGTFLFTKYVVPLMKAGKYGKIINFSSKSGKTGSALMSHYSAAKAAVIGFTQALAYELAADNINVNCLCPGITESTGVWDKVSDGYIRNLKLPMDDVVKKFTAKVPLGRLASVEDITAVTLFLASKGADYMTGQAINITGGREMH